MVRELYKCDAYTIVLDDDTKPPSLVIAFSRHLLKPHGIRYFTLRYSRTSGGLMWIEYQEEGENIGHLDMGYTRSYKARNLMSRMNLYPYYDDARSKVKELLGIELSLVRKLKPSKIEKSGPKLLLETFWIYNGKLWHVIVNTNRIYIKHGLYEYRMRKNDITNKYYFEEVLKGSTWYKTLTPEDIELLNFIASKLAEKGIYVEVKTEEEGWEEALEKIRKEIVIIPAKEEKKTVKQPEPRSNEEQHISWNQYTEWIKQYLNQIKDQYQHPVIISEPTKQDNSWIWLALIAIAIILLIKKQ